MNNSTIAFLEADDCLDDGRGKLKMIRLIVYSFVSLAAIFGNILILVSLRKFSDFLKGTPYILLGNLAVADLILAVGLTLQITGSIFQPMKAEIYFCAVITCLVGISITASGILLMFISIDRFCAIVFPMKHLIRSTRVTSRRIKLLFVWILSVTFVCAVVISNTILKPTGSSECDHCVKAPKGISLALAVFMTSQFIINIVMCLIVIWSLKSNNMSMQKYNKSMVKCRLLIRVYVVFALCWSPYIVTTILTETSSDKQRYANVRPYTVMPGLMNSAMNWIIYGLSNKKLRESFKNVLLCRSQRQMFLSNYIQTNKLENKYSSSEIQTNETAA